MEGNEQIGHLQVRHPLIQRVKCSFGSVRFILLISLPCSYYAMDRTRSLG